MANPTVAPYGSWKSPITSKLIVSESISLSGIEVEGDDLFWIEMRPSEDGRSVIVRRDARGEIEEINPHPFDARTRVHEYGGGAYLVHEGIVFFSDFADQRLYRRDPGSEPHPITRRKPWRYADGVYDAKRDRIYCVREDHTDSDRDAVNTIESIDAACGGEPRLIAAGYDFYSNPRLSPDGSTLCWLSWNHSNMPWDGTELWVATLTKDGEPREAKKVAGGVDESIFQPEWSPDGTLYFISDRSGWWNLYRARDGRVEPLAERDAEFGRPGWRFGASTYAFESAARIVCSFTEGGVWRLAMLNTENLALTPIEVAYTAIADVRVAAGKVYFLGGSPTVPTSVVAVDLESGETEVLKLSSNLDIDEGYLSRPEAIEFPTEQGLTSHAFFYPPANRDFLPPEGERPPLIVFTHGGPTGSTSDTFSAAIQFWTSRGIAVVDVNYGGSTGYGREYRERLKGNWGIVDIDDCVNATRYLVDRGDADGERLAIRGGSAGGYTTLAALTFRNVFKAGASYFGVSDLGALARDTHKFESRYLDGLIGPYPEREDLYRERSPIFSVDRLAAPLILFQGLEDKVVPPNQAETMVEALMKKGLPVAYIAYEGEQHGFRGAKTIRHSIESELYFYSRVFGFEPADPLEPVKIENLP